LRALGELQLQIQFAISSTYDTQAMGILGLNAALAAAAVAGDQLLGRRWWLALIGLMVSSLIARSALVARIDKVGLDLTSLVAHAEEASGDEMDQAIVLGLRLAIAENNDGLKKKADRVWVSIIALFATIVVAIAVVLAF
jgi:hypothetical protein